MPGGVGWLQLVPTELRQLRVNLVNSVRGIVGRNARLGSTHSKDLNSEVEVTLNVEVEILKSNSKGGVSEFVVDLRSPKVAIAAATVRYLGGSLHLQSLPGVGTCAYLYLKRLESEAREELPTSSVSSCSLV